MAQHNIKMRIFKGEADSQGNVEGKMEEFTIPVEEGMVVLDAVHYVQGNHDPELACRWNCKAAKCGSCSAEVNGKPSLMCKTRLDDFDPSETIEVRPMHTFPLIKDLVTDVSWNYEVNKLIKPFTPANDDQDSWRFNQLEADRVQEFRKCIECFLCLDVCHVLRNSEKHSVFAGPRWFIRTASLEMHPLDTADRVEFLKEGMGLGFCNITRCCTEVCPEEINITDNGIIPMKERVVDRYHDPLQKIARAVFGQ